MSSHWIQLPPSGGGSGAVDSVNGLTGVVVLTKSNIGLGNVNNTSDATKNAAVATLTNKTISTTTNSITGTASRAAQFNGSGNLAVSTVTSAELDFVSGVTSSIQDQLDTKVTSGTQIIAADGTGPADPGIRFTTDNDSGLYQTGDGNISISANGNRKISIDQSLVTVDVDLTIDGNISADNFPPAGVINRVAGFDGSGDLYSINGWNIDTVSGGLNVGLTEAVSNDGTRNIQSTFINIEPTINSPSSNVNMLFNQINFDTLSSGFTYGTGGRAVLFNGNSANHAGTGDIGSIDFMSNFMDIGNGTDPIDVKGFTYLQNQGVINANVTISGGISGVGFQPTIDAAATISPGGGITAFYDYANIGTSVPGYQSMQLNPTISSIQNNTNYLGLGIGPTIPTFTGNAGFTGIGIFPNLGTFGTNGFQGIAMNPNITSIPATSNFTGIGVSPNVTLNSSNITGLNINMGNVTNAAGVSATLVVQDITYTLNQTGTDGNNITVEYTNTTTAGSEVANFSFPAITVSIQSGVSTATQVLAALAANFTISSNLTTTITGTAGNAQVTYGPTNLAGGVNAGTVMAAQFTGDVSINGALSFTGGLSIGALSSFASHDAAIFPGGVNSIDTLITSPTLAASGTVTGVDVLGVNTAMLLTLGNGATWTSSFLGVAALGLPAVVSMGTGSTIDRVEGAVFAISLDGAATGGTVDEVNLCRALALPNGVTTLTRLIAYEFDLPFGDPGTTTWGVYMAPTCHNYMAGDLKIGTAGGDTAGVGSALDVAGDASVTGDIAAATMTPANGATGTFTTTDLKTVTVTNGIITSIV